MTILRNNQSVVQLSYQRSAASAVTATQAVRSTTSGNVQPATTNLRSLPFDGIALNSATTGQTIYVSAHGLLDPTTFNLGDGYACTVGTTVAGFPVRATDPTCVSAPNWLGHCDVKGNISISPRRDTEFNVLDWGLDPTGVTSCDAVFRTMLDQTTTGDVIMFPRGTYKFLEGIVMPRPQMGIEIRGGSNGNATHGIFPPLNHTILSFSNATGDGIRVCTDPTTNSHGFLTLSDFTMDQTNVANRAWNSEASEAWLKGGAAIGMIGGQRLICTGLEFTGLWRFGIAMDGSEQCKFEDIDCRNGIAPEVDGYQSFGIWFADATRGMSVASATNVHRVRRVYGNAPAFLFLLDASVANTFSDCMTNLTPFCPAGMAMVRGASYVSFKNGYVEGDNATGAAMFYFCGGQSINFRIEGGFYTGVGVAFAHLGPNPFGTVGQAAGLQIVGVDLACDWIVNSNYITNAHVSMGNILSGDIVNVRNNQMYDVVPGMTTGLIANTGDGNGYAMGTHANPKAQHHWALREFGSALHLDGTEPYRFREFWADGMSRFRTLETPYSSITGFRCQNDRGLEYVYTEDDGPDGYAAALVIGNRVMGTAIAQVEAVWSGDETKTASWEIRQKFRRNEGGNVTLVGSATVVWSDADAGGSGFTAPNFSVNVSAQTIRVNVKSRTDGQVYYLVNSRVQGVHP